MSETTSNALGARVVSKEEWLKARRELLIEEKELTRRRDAVNARRRELPWVKIDKDYHFTCPDGNETLGDLFAGRSQLIVQHFMFGPGWGEGCVGCSFLADHIDGALVHLENHDVSFVAVSRAPWQEIEPFKKRMEWQFKWVSSAESDFNYDFHVSATEEEQSMGKVFYNYVEQDFESEELSAHSVFYRDQVSREIFHTYSTYGRGDELLINTYNFLDLTPKGRDETGPKGNLTDWVRHHDRYGSAGRVDHTGRFRAGEESKCCEP